MPRTIANRRCPAWRELLRLPREWAPGRHHSFAPDARPEWFRHRLKTVSLRGVDIQRLFGSQRALKTVEDFTEFEQRTAYFDGDIVNATKKGVNPLERGSQVDFMADSRKCLIFRPRRNSTCSASSIPRSEPGRDARAKYLLRQG